MDATRNTCLAMLLVVLAAPGAPGEVRDGPVPAIHGAGLPRVVRCRPSTRRRVTQSRKFPDISPSMVAKAGEYLRCRIGGRNPEPRLLEAWDRFYGDCDPIIRRFAGGFRHRGIDVEECVQDTWADLIRTLREFRLDRERGRFTSWLYSIVRNKAADQVRRSLRRPAVSLSTVSRALPAVDFDPAGRMVRADEQRALDDALRKLRTRISPISYRVLHLRHLEGRSVRETAHALGLTSQQVWTREHRAKERLRRVLELPSVTSKRPVRPISSYFPQG